MSRNYQMYKNGKIRLCRLGCLVFHLEPSARFQLYNTLDYHVSLYFHAMSLYLESCIRRGMCMSSSLFSFQFSSRLFDV
jgi:hypothetical protein